METQNRYRTPILFYGMAGSRIDMHFSALDIRALQSGLCSEFSDVITAQTGHEFPDTKECVEEFPDTKECVEMLEHI